MTNQYRVKKWLGYYCDSLDVPVLPIDEGGTVFAELSKRTGLSQDEIVTIATESGFWPHDYLEIEEFYRVKNIGEEEADEYLDELIELSGMVSSEQNLV